MSIQTKSALGPALRKLNQWETLGDAWSWLRFTWGRYQTDDEGAIPQPLLIGLLAVLFAGRLTFSAKLLRFNSSRQPTAH